MFDLYKLFLFDYLFDYKLTINQNRFKNNLFFLKLVLTSVMLIYSDFERSVIFLFIIIFYRIIYNTFAFFENLSNKVDRC